MVEASTALVNRRKYRYLDFIFPETGKYSRYNYPKALEFFREGKNHNFRMIGGANGSGKSFNGATELAYHITGEYPEWWEGARQEYPKLWWIVSESGKTFKSSLQRLLLGSSLNEEDLGTGLIPKDRIVGEPKAWSGITGAIEAFEVRHKNGHIVTVEVKSSDQKRENLQAANIDGVLFDEEPPLDIYTEVVMRLRSTSDKPFGLSMLCFTPLKGMTEVVLKYLDNGMYPTNGEHPLDSNKYIVRIEMDEVPHLTDQVKQMYLTESSAYDLEARTKGFPALGSGRIYPVSEEQVIVSPFPIPDYWPRAFGLDFGWHCTCALWGAKDPDTGIIYVYTEYYKGQQPAYVHAYAIKAKGEWIPGICDPKGGINPQDGKKTIQIYRELGLNLTEGENDILSGIARNLNLFESGQLKIFATCENTIKELRMYRYGEKDPNKPAPNQHDHAMDTMKYLTSMFDWVATTEIDTHQRYYNDDTYDVQNRRGSDPTTGY